MRLGKARGRGTGATRAAIIALALAALAACTAPTHVESLQIRADAGSAGGQAALAQGLHAGAPAWFSPWWHDYLHRAQAGYAVLALDRNGRGGWYVYCATAGCHLLDHPWSRSIKDVYYKHRALERCRARIAHVHPAARPACALYAIRDKIVWQGRPPWAGDADGSAGADGRAAVGATPDMIGVNQLLDMLEFWRVGRILPKPQ